MIKVIYESSLIASEKCLILSGKQKNDGKWDWDGRIQQITGEAVKQGRIYIQGPEIK